MNDNRHECKIGKCHKKYIPKKGHELFAEFANVLMGERAKWLENLVMEAYRAGGIEAFDDIMEAEEKDK